MRAKPYTNPSAISMGAGCCQHAHHHSAAKESQPASGHEGDAGDAKVDHRKAKAKAATGKPTSKKNPNSKFFYLTSVLAILSGGCISIYSWYSLRDTSHFYIAASAFEQLAPQESKIGIQIDRDPSDPANHKPIYATLLRGERASDGEKIFYLPEGNFSLKGRKVSFAANHTLLFLNPQGLPSEWQRVGDFYHTTQAAGERKPIRGKELKAIKAKC